MQALGDLIAAVFIPLVVSFLKQSGWPREYKIGLAAVIALAASVAVSASTGEVNSVPDLLTNWGVIFAGASTIYATVLEKSGLEVRLRAITFGSGGEGK